MLFLVGLADTLSTEALVSERPAQKALPVPPRMDDQTTCAVAGTASSSIDGNRKAVSLAVS